MSPDHDTPDRPDTGRQPDREPREYGHSTGDRNTRRKEGDFKPLRGGEQRGAEPETGPD